MALTKVTGKGITCSAVTEAKIGTSAVTSGKIDTNAVTSAKITDGTVSASDLASTLDLSSKTVTLPSGSVSASNLASTLDLSSKTVTLPGSATATVDQNIALLGFKMAVNDGLTVFNLVDGVVDEFNDESGTDEAEGSNDLYNATSDYYINSTQPDGQPLCGPISAGFSISAITEPDTSTTNTNPAGSSGSPGTFSVTGMTSLNAYLWGGGGGASQSGGGGGGFASGTFAVSPGQTLSITIAEGGEKNNGSPETGGGDGGFGGNHPQDQPETAGNRRGGGNGYPSRAAGLTYLGTATLGPAPDVVLVAGGGGGGGYNGGGGTGPGVALIGGAGGGLTGDSGSQTTETTARNNTYNGGGGSQSAGGQGGTNSSPGTDAQSGGFLYGGNGNGGAGGGAGYYGGGGGTIAPGTVPHGAGGGGSSYYGHPQITSGTTEEGSGVFGGGTGNPNYVAATNEGGKADPQSSPGGSNASCGAGDGEDGYLLITGCQNLTATATSTTVVSTAFTSTSVASTARIVVFEENVDTPTLNTDIIASVSRDGGTTFTNATLSDSGYVTGSSGQRILTGQADISGQPSGQSMRWKLALANNAVKIHGVALQWS